MIGNSKCSMHECEYVKIKKGQKYSIAEDNLNQTLENKIRGEKS